jgi:uncharacterized protein YkwD
MGNFQPRFLKQVLIVTPLLVLASLFYRTQLFAESAFTGCGGEIVSVTNAANEARVIELVNEQRAANGLPPMKYNGDLTNAARYHAADMKQDDYFNHQTQDRSNGALVRVCNWSERLKKYYTIYNGLAENIASVYDSPESVMEGWMNSSGHRANILGNYREIGVGFFDNYWVQDFGDRNNNYPVIINREAAQTNSPQVTLYIYGSWQQMRLRNDDDSWGDWQSFSQEVAWNLRNVGGERRVEVELSNGSANVTSSDTILLAGAAPTPAPTAAPTPGPTTPPPTGKFFIYLPTAKR